MSNGADQLIFTVVLGDANEQVLSALADMIAEHPGLTLVGIASDGDRFAVLCAEHKPDMAVFDLMRSTISGHLHDAVRSASPETLMAVFTARSDRRTRDRLLASGVHAVFVKGSVEHLGDALHEMLARHASTAGG